MNAVNRAPVAPSAVPSRRRPRAVDMEAPAPQSLDDLIAAAVEVNKQKNALARAEKAALKAVEDRMVADGKTSHLTTVDGARFEAVIAPGEKTTIDVAELYEQLDLKTFLQVVSATKTDVTKLCGSTMLSRVQTPPIKTPEKLSINKMK